MSDHRRKANTVSYPDGLEAAIVRALPSLRGHKRSANDLLAALRGHQELRSMDGVTNAQIEAALGTMADRGQFNPDQYILPARSRARHRASDIALAAAASH
jgi:hypothetical protein